MLEASDIYADINSYPPLRRQEIANTYIGKEVDWLLTFSNGSEEQDEAHLIFRSEPHQIRMITGTVALSDYPWLRSLASDERVRVRGRIRRVDELITKLDILELALPEPAKV